MVNLDQESLDRLNIDKNDKSILKELLFTRGDPAIILRKLKNIYGNNNVIEELEYLFNTLSKISKKYNIKIQLDPTYQPHLNLYAGIVFQLICENNNIKSIIFVVLTRRVRLQLSIKLILSIASNKILITSISGCSVS